MINYNYLNYKFNKKQQKSWESLNFLPNKQILDNPIKEFKKFTLIQKTIFDIFLALNNRYANIYITQSSIAKIAKCSRKTVNETIQYFNELGLIATLNRGVKKTCLYKISSFFLNPDVRKGLCKFFKALKYFSILWLFSTGNQAKAHEVTQYYFSLSSFTRRESVTLKNNGQKEKETINNNKEKEGLTKKVRSNMETIWQIQKKFKLNQQIVDQLALFDKKALDYAWSIVEQEKFLKNTLSYLLRSYITYCKQHKIKIQWFNFYKVKELMSDNSRTIMSKPKPVELNKPPVISVVARSEYKKPVEKKLTAMQMASELVKFNKVPVNWIMTEAFKQRCIANLLKNDFIVVNEPGEDVAIEFIHASRKKLGILDLVDEKGDG